jgi:hypothetical protein
MGFSLGDRYARIIANRAEPTHPMRWRIVAVAVASVAAVAAPGARADDQAVLQVATTQLPRASHAAFVAAGQGGTDAVQAQYDAARDMQEALSAAAPASPACEPLASSLAGFAQAQVSQAEGVDRQEPAQIARARADATRVLAGYVRARAACLADPAPVTRAPLAAQVDDPGSYEAFFGAVRARAPTGAVNATVALDGEVVARAAIARGWLRTRVPRAPRHGRLVVTFLSAAGRVVGRSISESVWLLPQNASSPIPAVRPDAQLDTALSRAATSFSGISAVYTLDLTTGASGSWNADARFPAASTVKLGVLAAALRHFGPRPELRSSFYDLRALAAWSSNLAANRLLAKIGGSGLAENELHRLGAGSSTYTGNYIVGTRLAGRSPPLVSRRVTTARDLGTALMTLERAAVGDARARARSGLSVHEARVALGLLLSSQPVGDNVGMIRQALGPAIPIAQKQGWLPDARLTAAIVYSARGPRVVVICAYEYGLTLASATRLGRRVVSALGIR